MLRAASTLVRARPRAQITGWPEARAVRASQAAGAAALLLTPVSIASLVLAGPACVTALVLSGPASIAIRLRTMTARRAMARVPAFWAGLARLNRIVMPGYVLVTATARAAAGICCVRRAGLTRARPR